MPELGPPVGSVGLGVPQAVVLVLLVQMVPWELPQELPWAPMVWEARSATSRRLLLLLPPQLERPMPRLAGPSPMPPTWRCRRRASLRWRRGTSRWRQAQAQRALAVEPRELPVEPMQLAQPMRPMLLAWELE